MLRSPFFFSTSLSNRLLVPAAPIFTHSLRFSAAAASSSSARDPALDRVRKAGAQAGGRRSVHHQFARRKAIHAALTLHERKFSADTGAQQDVQTAPTLREQMMLKKLADRSFRNVPGKISAMRKKLRVYHKDFETFYFFREEDVVEQSILGRGPGGQATNRRRQTCQIHHKPTGINIRFSRFRSLYSNRKVARMLLSMQIEKKLFGKFSKLGSSEMHQKARDRKRHKMRERLLKMGQQQDSAHGEGAAAASSSSSSSSLSLSSLERRFPVTASYAHALGCGGDKMTSRNLNHFCWSDMGFISLHSAPEGKHDQCRDDEERPEAASIKDLLEPPFSDEWWTTLERAWAHQQQQQEKAPPLPIVAPPAWFCLLFPVFPTSPLLLQNDDDGTLRKQSASLPVGRVFVGPRDAWEGHERSYIKTELQQNDEVEMSLRQPYINFFEMFGLRVATAVKGKGNRRVVLGISRDAGLNWFEGRQRLCEHPELTVLLWTHVLRSALEFCFDDIVGSVVDFVKDAAANEKHDETRQVLGMILSRL